VNAHTQLSAGVAPAFPTTPGASAEPGTVPRQALVPAPDPPEPPAAAAPTAGAEDVPEGDPDTWAGRFLGLGAAGSWPEEGRRLAFAVGLASLFGVSLGLRKGGLAIALAAIGAPAGIVAVAALAVPAFAIVLALANAPVDAKALARATARGAAKTGLVLAGLAPAAALFVVTVEDAITVTIVGFGSLLLAGVIGARSFAKDLGALLGPAPRATRAAMSIALPAFLLFVAVLAARVWWLALPFLTENL
jgi:hypothetical protein